MYEKILVASLWIATLGGDFALRPFHGGETKGPGGVVACDPHRGADSVPSAEQQLRYQNVMAW